MKNDYVVIGLGRFGKSIVETLADHNQKIYVVDNDGNAIEEVSNQIYAAMKIDATNFNALQKSGIQDVDNIIIAISDLKTSILSCINVLDLTKDKKQQSIIAKASNKNHARVLKSIGINNIVLPEKEAGRKTALRCVYNLAIDITEIGTDHAIIKCSLLNPRLHDAAIQDVPWRSKYSVNIIAVTRNHKVFMPSAHDILKINDEIILVCRKDQSKKIYNFITASK